MAQASGFNRKILREADWVPIDDETLEEILTKNCQVSLKLTDELTHQ